MNYKNLKFLLIPTLLLSCGQSYNSNSFDKEKYKNQIDITSPEGKRFFLAYSVIKDKCISCHTGYHNSYSGYTKSSDWTSIGLVSAGDYDGSFLKNKLKNYGGNMPASGSELSDIEIAYLQDWVDQL